MDLTDTWRILHPTDRQFTRYAQIQADGKEPRSVPKRIDYILTNHNLNPFVISSNIISQDTVNWLSDHAIVHIQVAGLAIIQKVLKNIYQRPIYKSQTTNAADIQGLVQELTSPLNQTVTEVESRAIAWMNKHWKLTTQQRSFSLYVKNEEYQELEEQIKVLNLILKKRKKKL